MTSNLKKIPGVEVFIEKVGKKHKIKQLKVFRRFSLLGERN